MNKDALDCMRIGQLIKKGLEAVKAGKVTEHRHRFLSRAPARLGGIVYTDALGLAVVGQFDNDPDAALAALEADLGTEPITSYVCYTKLLNIRAKLAIEIAAMERASVSLLALAEALIAGPALAISDERPSGWRRILDRP